MNRLFKLSSLLAISTAAVLIASGARADSSTITSNFTFPFSMEAENCATFEPVVVSGYMHGVAHVTLTSSGHMNAEFHFNSQELTGVSASGVKYQANITTNEMFSTQAGGAVETTFNETFLLIAKGKVPDMKVQATVHVTVNANGAATAEVTEAHAQCK